MGGRGGQNFSGRSNSGRGRGEGPVGGRGLNPSNGRTYVNGSGRGKNSYKNI